MLQSFCLWAGAQMSRRRRHSVGYCTDHSSPRFLKLVFLAYTSTSNAHSLLLISSRNTERLLVNNTPFQSATVAADKTAFPVFDLYCSFSVKSSLNCHSAWTLSQDLYVCEPDRQAVAAKQLTFYTHTQQQHALVSRGFHCVHCASFYRLPCEASANDLGSQSVDSVSCVVVIWGQWGIKTSRRMW